MIVVLIGEPGALILAVLLGYVLPESVLPDGVLAVWDSMGNWLVPMWFLALAIQLFKFVNGLKENGV